MNEYVSLHWTFLFIWNCL